MTQTQFVHTVSAFGGSVTQSGWGDYWEGAHAWVDISNSLTDNNLDTYVDINRGTSKALEIRDFGFNISTGATVLGIQMEVKYKTPVEGIDRGLLATLLHPVSGDSETKKILIYPDTPDYRFKVYGAPNDLWALTWEASDINNPAFGCKVVAIVPYGDGQTYWVDYMKLAVTYMDAVPGNDSGGMYEGAHPLWIGPNNWIATYNATSNKYFITTNYDGGYNPSLPAWTLVGSSPEGTYSPEGDGYPGPINAEILSQTINYTNQWANNTVFYQCWLVKTAMTNDSFYSPEIEHNPTYWYLPGSPSPFKAFPNNPGSPWIYPFGQEMEWIFGTNYFDDQGSGLQNGVWTKKTTGWTSNFSSPAYFIGDPSVPPEKAPDPEANLTSISGFILNDNHALVDWSFLYCTNR